MMRKGSCPNIKRKNCVLFVRPHRRSFVRCVWSLLPFSMRAQQTIWFRICHNKTIKKTNGITVSVYIYCSSNSFASHSFCLTIPAHTHTQTHVLIQSSCYRVLLHLCFLLLYFPPFFKLSASSIFLLYYMLFFNWCFAVVC